MVFDFVDGGADGELTLRANRDAFDAVRFDPRFLADVAGRDTSTTVLGQRVELPFLLAPAGLATVVHPEGELAVGPGRGPSRHHPRRVDRLGPLARSHRRGGRPGRCGSSSTSGRTRR